MSKIIVNSADLVMIADELDLDCATLAGIADEDDLDVVEYCADEIQRAAQTLRNIINTAPEQPAPGIDVVNLYRDASPEILKSNGAPAADAGSRFRHGQDPEPNICFFDPIRKAIQAPAGNGWEDVNQ